MEKIFDYLRDEDLFITFPALVAGMFGIFMFVVTGNGFFKVIVPGVYSRLAIYVVLEGLFVLAWFYKRNVYPRNRKNRIGLVVAITTENNKHKVRLKSDLIDRLSQLIHDNQLQDIVNIVLMKNHQAMRLLPAIRDYSSRLAHSKQSGVPVEAKDVKPWIKAQKRIRGHFFVWGSILERQDVETKYYLEFHGLVLHPPAHQQLQKELIRDFQNVWIYQFSFIEKAEYQGFRLSADYVFVASKYIIGLAAFYSGDVFTALRLHENLEAELVRITDHPNIDHIRNRLRIVLAEEHVAAARWYYIAERNMAKAREHFENGFSRDPNNYGAHLFKAIIELSQGNPNQALKTIYRAKTLAGIDGSWRYGEGFLLLNLEKFDKAIPVYHKIGRTSYPGEEITVQQVCEFNEQFLTDNPQYPQSHFILGYLKQIKRGNYPEAFEHFKTFLELVKNKSKFRPLITEAERCMRQVEKRMGL